MDILNSTQHAQRNSACLNIVHCSSGPVRGLLPAPIQGGSSAAEIHRDAGLARDPPAPTGAAWRPRTIRAPRPSRWHTSGKQSPQSVRSAGMGWLGEIMIRPADFSWQPGVTPMSDFLHVIYAEVPVPLRPAFRAALFPPASACVSAWLTRRRWPRACWLPAGRSATSA